MPGFDAWLTGRKRFQNAARAELPLFEADGERIKVNPLAGWSAVDLHAYIARHDLPEHPLVAKGYPSIGCVPCTTRVLPGEDQRAGRWRGLDKTECGIHVDARDRRQRHLRRSPLRSGLPRGAPRMPTTCPSTSRASSRKAGLTQ